MQTSVSRVDDSEPQLSPHPVREIVWSPVLLDSLHPRSSRTSWWFPPVLRRGSSYDIPCICLVWHSCNMAEQRKTPCCKRPALGQLTASTGLPSCSASSSNCVCWHTRRCMDWHRSTSLASVDQSQPSVADKDSDPLVVATSLSSRTLTPVHLLFYGGSQGLESTADAHTSTGVSWLLQDGTKDTFPLRWLSPNCPGMPHPCNDSIMLWRIRNCQRYYYY